jgi:nucleoporin NUP159
MALFTNEQERSVEKLVTRISKLDLSSDLQEPRLPTALTHRDPRLPDPPKSAVSPTSQVAITTAAALNAERSAAKLKKALLAVRSRPILNTTAAHAEPAPVAFGAQSTIMPSAPLGTFPPPQSPFTTPVKSSTSEGGPNLFFPEDKFSPGTPLTPSKGMASRSSKSSNHTPGIKKQGSPGAATAFSPPVNVSPSPAPAPSFDWGPLPDFSKGPGNPIQFKPLPGFVSLTQNKGPK